MTSMTHYELVAQRVLGSSSYAGQSPEGRPCGTRISLLLTREHENARQDQNPTNEHNNRNEGIGPNMTRRES